MGEEAAKFISQFHQLSGESAKERQANSYKLFHQYKNHLEKNKRDLIFISQNLKPTTHLEKILQVDFFIYFRRFAELYSEFLKGNDIVLSKLAKQRWFFIKAFAHLSCKEFVEEVLPQVGYNVKLKILRRLVVSEHKCDEIFEALRERYGLFLALNVLTKCSNKKILDVLNTETIRLTFRQFEQIHEKESSLTRVYIEKRSKDEGSLKWLNDSPIFQYLALKNPKLFSELVQNDEFVKRLGRRTSKALIKTQKEKILEKPELWIDVLNSSKLVKHLGDNYKILFLDGGKPIVDWKSLLSHYPKKHQFEIYKTVIHDKIHRHKFGESPDTILPEILQIIPESNIREKYAKIKYEKDGDDDYLEYFTSTFCIQKFLNKLPHLKRWERQKFLTIATKCCILNKDREGLSKLCELVAKRFKNDGNNIRQTFFSILCEQKSTFSLLTKEHWTLIMEIDATIIAQEEYNSHSIEIRIKYVEFLIKNNAHNLKDVIANYPIEWFDILYWSFPNFKQYGKLLQEMVKIVIEIGHPKPPNKENAAAVYDCEIANKVKAFNQHCPKYAINIFNHKRMRKSIFQMMQTKNLDDNTWSSFQGILYMVCQKNTSDVVKIMHKLFFANIKKCGDLENCLWFAKHQPKTLKEHFGVVLDNYANFYKTKTIVSAFWKTIKKCSHYKLDEAAITYFKDNIKNEDLEDKKHLVQALLFVSDSASSVDFIKTNYMPVSSTVDLTDQSIKDLYAIQSELLKHLHYACTPEEIAQITLDFCKGDFLKHALHPLYSCCYRLPEKNTLKIIEQLFKIKAVSTRKHSLYLSCAVLPRKTVNFYLEDNSISSIYPTLKYFNNNPSPTLWTLLENKIVASEKTDVEALRYLFDVSLPPIYNAKLFECIWTIFNQYGNVSCKKMLFEKAGKPVGFSLKFVEQLIEDCLLKASYANVFIANLLLDFADEKKFEAIKKSFINLRLAKKELKLFVKTMFDVYVERKKANFTFASKFSVVFNEVFDPHEAFEEFVLTNLMPIKDQTIENSAEILLKIFENFQLTYGTSTTLVLADFMQNTLPQVFKTDDQIFELCYNLSEKVPQSKDDFLWITKLLPKSVPEYQKTFMFYSHLKNKLIALNDDTIKLIFNWNLMSGSNDNNLDQEILL